MLKKEIVYYANFKPFYSHFLNIIALLIYLQVQEFVLNGISDILVK